MTATHAGAQSEYRTGVSFDPHKTGVLDKRGIK